MKKLIIISLFIAVLSMGAFIIINNQSPKTISNNNLQVSTSFYPMYFFASEIGKGNADVNNITPAGSEPHDYEPTTRDIAKIERGQMIILNGSVESWAEKVKENLKGTNVKIIIAGAGLLTGKIEEDGKVQIDPHIWLDPQLAKIEVEKITEGYISIDPMHASTYQENQKNLNFKLDDLDNAYLQGLKNCVQRDIITSHAAFGYLATRYSLKQIAISGLSPDSEPSAKQLVAVADFAKKNNVKYIFFESLVSPKLAETIAQEVEAKTLVLDPLEGISDDDISQGKNYFTIMENNLRNLQEALQCNK